MGVSVLLRLFISNNEVCNYKTTYAPSEDSDQPAHIRSLTSLLCPSENAVDHWLPTLHLVRTDQTVWMHTLDQSLR